MKAPSGYSRALLGVVAALCILGAACAGGASEQTASTAAPTAVQQRFQLGMAVHVDEPTVSAFWSQVALGAFEAAESFEVDLEVRGDFNPGVQALIVEAMVAADIDGLIVSLADPEALKPALAAASWR